MKQRFSTLDVRASCAELKSKLVGMRLQNCYDINPRTYLFKFSKPDAKELVLIESGIRMHTTDSAREKNIMPSSFSAKLRKHLKSKRLTNVQQLGWDRIADFVFGEGEFAFHVIVEFCKFIIIIIIIILNEGCKPNLNGNIHSHHFRSY